MSTASTLAPAQFVALVREVEPEAGPLIDEHFNDFDELLIHLLMADLLRFVVDQFGKGRVDISNRVLAVVDRALIEGNEALVNAVAVSFVEHVGWAPGETPEFIASWPTALLAERQAQVEWYERRS